MPQQSRPQRRSSRPPLVRGPFARPRVQVKIDPETGLTHQSFKDECDINRIVETYARTGIIPSRRLEPVYGDAPDADLFEAACVQAELRSALEDGYEFVPPETASEAAGEPISEKAGDTPAEKTAPQGASQPADGESGGV